MTGDAAGVANEHRDRGLTDTVRRAIFQKVRFDDAAPVEVLELQSIGRYVQRGIEWEQSDELSAQHLHARVVRAALDFVPHRRERRLGRVEQIHRDLRARRTREREPERLDRGQAA